MSNSTVNEYHARILEKWGTVGLFQKLRPESPKRLVVALTLESVAQWWLNNQDQVGYNLAEDKNEMGDDPVSIAIRELKDFGMFED